LRSDRPAGMLLLSYLRPGEDYPYARERGGFRPHSRGNATKQTLTKPEEIARDLHWHHNKENGGLEHITLMGKKNVQFLATIADICDLLDEIIAHRKRKYRKVA